MIMKTFLILMSLLTIVNLINAASSEEDETQNEFFAALDKIKSPTPYLREIIDKTDVQYNITNQFNDSCPDILRDVINAAGSAYDCVRKNCSNLTQCGGLKLHFLPCITPLVNVIDNCLPEKSKGIPNLFANNIDSGLKYLCSLSGEQMFEFMNDCIIPTEKNEKDFKTLESNVEIESQRFDNSTVDISVQDVCSFGSSLKKHASIYINQSCANQFTRNVFIGLLDAIHAPCVEINKQ